MSLATVGIDCTVSLPLLGAMEDCSVVRGPQLQRLCRQNCCMSGQHENRKRDSGSSGKLDGMKVDRFGWETILSTPEESMDPDYTNQQQQKQLSKGRSHVFKIRGVQSAIYKSRTIFVPSPTRLPFILQKSVLIRKVSVELHNRNKML